MNYQHYIPLNIDAATARLGQSIIDELLDLTPRFDFVRRFNSFEAYEDDEFREDAENENYDMIMFSASMICIDSSSGQVCEATAYYGEFLTTVIMMGITDLERIDLSQC